MKRIVLIFLAGVLGLATMGALALQQSGRDQRNPALAGRATPSQAAPSGQLESPRQPAIPARSSSQGPAPAAAPVRCSPAAGGRKGAEAQLVDVRVGTHNGHDRLTFEFAPSQLWWAPFDVPQYKIKSVPVVTEDASGKPIPLEGRRFAQIVFWGASGSDLYGKPTYRGPSDFRPRFPALAEAKAAGDFERVLTWGVGLSERSCWQVSVLRDPARVVIDFPHAPPTAASSGPRKAKSAADATLDAFMDARMRRDAAAAKPYLSAHAKEQLCEDWTCILMIGVSNPHYASWEVVSRKEQGGGKVLFGVRIHMEVTDLGETEPQLESIEVGPGRNYLGQMMDAVVLSVDQ
jgi:hypothetical protein